MPPFLNPQIFTVAFFQTNVLVESDGTPRIAGLGSSFFQSSPVAWSEDLDELTRSSAPELANHEAFGLPKPQNTTASDVYAFGVLAWEVKHAHPSQSQHNRLIADCRFLHAVACSPT